MKILIVTGGDKRHFYLCQKISEFFPRDNIDIFFNAKIDRDKRIRNRFHNFKFKTKANYLKKYLLNNLFFYYVNFVKKEYEIEQNIFFKTYQDNFLKKKHLNNIKIHDLYKLSISVNSAQTLNILKNITPDITIVMGSALLNKEFIKNAGFILNIHTGLSPYYRGGNSNFWPIVNKQPNYCGYTIHLMTSGIDSGPILFSDFVDARKYELSYPKVNNICILKAIEKLPEIIKNRGSIIGIKQWNNGLHYKNIDFNGFQCFKYVDIKKRFLDNKKTLKFDNTYPDVCNRL